MAGMKTEVPIKNSASSDGVAAAAKQAAYTEERRRYWDAYARKQPGWDGPRRFYRQRLAELYRFVIPPGSPRSGTGMRGRRSARGPAAF